MIIQYKYILVAIFIAVFINPGCYKQKNPEILENAFFNSDIINYSYYSSISSSAKVLVYSENFNNGAGAWWTGDQNNLEASVSNGSYTIKNSDGTLWRWLKQNISLDSIRNFEFEARVKMVYSQTNDGAGIALVNSSGDLLPLLLDVSNQISIFNYNKISNKKTDYIPWTYYSWLYASNWTLLTIRKAGDRYFFFVDKNNLGLELPSTIMIPNEITLFLSGNASMSVDEITFSYF